MTAFAEYLKSRKDEFEKTAEKFKADEKQEYAPDEKLWYPEGDKVGNGAAIIRFLPPNLNSKSPHAFVKLYRHGFQGPTGSWLVENCPTTLGKDHECPVCTMNSQLWNSGLESDKNLARDRKRKLYYFSNVYVIKDEANPQNNGKVFVYRYGKMFYDMLHDKMYPSFEDQAKVNPFDLLEGATLRIRFKFDKSKGFRSYTGTEFDPVGPLFEDTDKMAAVYESMHDLHEYVDPDTFRSAEEIKNRMTRVLGNNPKGQAPKATAREEEIETEVSISDAIDNVETEDFDKFFSELEN